jgi:rhodanese-related sulfurtransferase
MSWRKHLLEAATLIVAAVVCALVANAVASRERKVALVPAPAPASGERRAASGPPPAPVPASGEQRAASGPQPASLPASSEQRAASGTPPQQTPTPRQPAIVKSQPPKEFKPHPDKPYIEIHGDDVPALHASGVLFLDARRTSVYEQGHIAGARPFSVWESDIDDKVNKLYAERSDPRDQEKPIVIYCSGGDCEDSHMLAQKLWGIQFNNVYVYKDGFPDWEKRGGAIRTGTEP